MAATNFVSGIHRQVRGDNMSRKFFVRFLTIGILAASSFGEQTAPAADIQPLPEAVAAAWEDAGASINY